jgi:hypothetical protein
MKNSPQRRGDAKNYIVQPQSGKILITVGVSLWLDFSYSVHSQENIYNKGIIIQINFRHKNTFLGSKRPCLRIITFTGVHSKIIIFTHTHFTN